MTSVRPFRLGTTSFILQEDYLPNIRFLAGRVDDVALLFFEPLLPHQRSGLGWIGEADALRRVRDLSFSVHLPAAVKLASADESLRLEAVQACMDVMEAVAALEPVAYVCHALGDSPGALSDRELEQLARSLGTLGVACGDPKRICVENVDLPHACLKAALDAAQVSICYDVGHAILNGQDVCRELAEWISRCGVLHLHGVSNGKDHHALDALPEALLHELLAIYASEAGPDWRVLTLELFEYKRWESSMAIFGKAWESFIEHKEGALRCR